MRGLDGFDVQHALADLGMLDEVAAEIGFDIRDRMVRIYQERGALLVDGKIGPITTAALRADTVARGFPGFSTFQGSLAPLVQFEGHRGRPYWPGGKSGITLDPGFDIAFQSPARIRALYGDILSPRQIDRLISVRHLRGADALHWVGMPHVREIEISREQASIVLPFIAATFWAEICGALPHVIVPEVPPGLHSALLSLAYNLGSDDLARFRGLPIGAWDRFADEIRRSPGDRARRAAEAALVRIATVLDPAQQLI